MKNLYGCVLSLLIISCASYTLGRDVKKESQKICMNSEGQGRLIVNNQKYVFGYDSLMEADNHKWSLELDFPLRSEETFELDWSENETIKFNSSIDQKILRENRDVNPKELDAFVKSIGHFLKDLIKMRQNTNEKLAYEWSVKKNKLLAQSPKGSATLVFDGLDADGYFKKMSMAYQSGKNQSYKMVFIVRKCFN